MTHTVSGTIRFDGQLVTRGAINFYPEQGKPLGGAINHDGTYQFELPAGTYRVAINAPPQAPPGWRDGDPAPETEAQLPPEYARPDTSGLLLVVSGKEASLVRDFDLPGNGKRRPGAAP